MDGVHNNFNGITITKVSIHSFANGDRIIDSAKVMAKADIVLNDVIWICGFEIVKYQDYCEPIVRKAWKANDDAMDFGWVIRPTMLEVDGHGFREFVSKRILDEYNKKINKGE